MPILDISTAAGWVKMATELPNPMLVCDIYCGHHADRTASAQTPHCGGCSYHPWDDIVLPPAMDFNHDIGEDSDCDGEMRRLNP